MGRPRGKAAAFALVLVLLLAGAAFAAFRDVPRWVVKDHLARAAAAVLVDPWMPSGDWRSAAPSPVLRLEGPAVAANGRLYVFGGFTGREWAAPALKRVDYYDPAADSWTRVADLPIDVTHVTAAKDGPRIWIAGGWQGPHPGKGVRATWTYDTQTDRWHEGPPLPKALAGGALVRLGRSLHYIGGILEDRDTTVGDHLELDLDGGAEWRPRAPLPIPRGHLAGFALDGKIYAVGGQARHDTNPIDLAAVHVYDPDEDRWSARASLPSPRSHFEPGSFVIDGRIVIVGGSADQRPPIIKRIHLSDVLAYDPASDRWFELPGLPVGLMAPAAGVVDGRLIVTNGSTIGSRGTQLETFIRPFTWTTQQ